VLRPLDVSGHAGPQPLERLRILEQGHGGARGGDRDARLPLAGQQQGHTRDQGSGRQGAGYRQITEGGKLVLDFGGQFEHIGGAVHNTSPQIRSWRQDRRCPPGRQSHSLAMHPGRGPRGLSLAGAPP